MSDNINLEELIKSCNAKNTLQLYVKKSNNKMCWMNSRIMPDMNLELKITKNGLIVQYYGSTYDLVSKNAVKEEDVIKGLTLLLNGDKEPDCEEINALLNW